MRDVAVRPYRSEDEAILFGLARLDRGADERTLAVLARETVFVAEVAGAPAGYVALDHDEDAVRVDQLFVSAEHEAQGVGRRLLEFAEGYAISVEASVLQVVVRGDDSRAVEFYRGRGFVRAGEELLELVLPQYP
ncbi:MAG: GNAT family N-acetyltransferase [Gaiellaceae bacterium]